MKRLFSLFTVVSTAITVTVFSSPIIAQEPDFAALEQRMNQASETVSDQIVEIREIYVVLRDLETMLFVTHNCQYVLFYNPEKRKLCKELFVEMSFKRMELIMAEDALAQAQRLYEERLGQLLEALASVMFADEEGAASNGQDNQSQSATQTDSPIAGVQGGIVALITNVHPAIYRSGGNPSTRSNHYSVVEYSLTNTTEAGIHFTSGTMVSNHAWNGEMVETNIGYGRTLNPGKTLNLSGHCVIPHDERVGTWVASGTGQHRGLETPTPEDQFGWNLSTTCTVN